MTPTRRHFVQGLLAAGVLSQTRAFAQTTPNWLLLGTHDGQGIYRAPWDARTGHIGAPELATPTPQPTYITLHPRLPVLYACNELDTAGSITAFTLDRTSASLTPLGSTPAGSAPCFSSIDGTGQALFAANYGSGSLSAVPLGRDGAPSPAQSFTCTPDSCGAPGPQHDRQTSSHLHCAVVSPGNDFVLACDLGADSILVFPIHPGQPELLGTPRRFSTAPGAGPRHLAFHPNGRWLFCINELSCDVTVFSWHGKHGKNSVGGHLGRALSAPVSILPAGVRPGLAADGKTTNTAAELAFSPDGRFLYTSTRGVDLLTVLAVDARSGALTQLQQIPCGGIMPRFFALDPTGQWLLCAHQASNTITTFIRNIQSGQLTLQGTYPATNPECIVWV